jgi:hypothetical protein
LDKVMFYIYKEKYPYILIINLCNYECKTHLGRMVVQSFIDEFRMAIQSIIHGQSITNKFTSKRKELKMVYG